MLIGVITPVERSDTMEELKNLAVYYAVTPKSLTLTLNEALVKRALLRAIVGRLKLLPNEVGGSLPLLSGLSGRSLYIHMNNTNPIVDAASPEARSVREAGVEIRTEAPVERILTRFPGIHPGHQAFVLIGVRSPRDS